MEKKHLVFPFQKSSVCGIALKQLKKIGGVASGIDFVTCEVCLCHERTMKVYGR